jgi:predicted PurR-regulated permease PerM
MANSPNKAADGADRPAPGAEDASDVKIENTSIENAAEQQDVHIKLENPVPVLRVALGTLAVLFVLFVSFLVYKSLAILLLMFLALLVATAIEPLVNVLRRGPFNRSAGILIVYTGLFVVIGFVVYLMFSVFLAQLGDFGTALGRSVTELRTSVSSIDNRVVQQQADLFLDVAEGFVAQVNRPAPAEDMTDEEKVEAVTSTALTVAELFLAIITIFVVAFYWLSERTLIKRGLMSWLPPRRANRIRRVWDDIEVKVGGWVRGQLTLMLVVGLASAVGYFVIGVKFWPALALFIAIAEAIPLVGPYIGTAPAVLVALTQNGNDGLPALLGMEDIGSVPRALLVVAFAFLLQTVEGNVLVPRIMKNSVGISPLTVIVSILLGATLAGLAGALVAVPLAGAIQVIVQDIKAARDSELKFQEETQAAAQTRAEAGELVVAYKGEGETRTKVESESQA